MLYYFQIFSIYMTRVNNHSSSKYWKSHKHYRSFVYRPYYYTYYDYPYYESQYISFNDKIYDPTLKIINKIKLDDGTVIEGFSTGVNRYIIFLIILLVIYIFCKINNYN